MHDIMFAISDLIRHLPLGDVVHYILPKVGVGGDIDVSGPIDTVAILTKTFIFLGGLGVIFGVGLAYAAARFAVKTDPKVEDVRNVLPGANCGACGFAGCQGFAEAVVSNPNVAPNLCAPGKSSVANQVARITGKIAEEKEPDFARIMCLGDSDKSTRRFLYEGIKDCRAAVLAGGGDKSCVYGCLGYGTCASVCPFHAIHMNDKNMPVVDITKCTGCRKCEQACPKNVIEVLPAGRAVLITCHSKDKGVETKKNCQVGCIACGICVKTCPYDAITITNNLARIDMDKCRVCGLCVTKCPQKCITDFIPARSKAEVLDNCIGCTVCMKICPVNAASGELKKMHVIDQTKCIGCGICVAKCAVLAIDGTFNAKEVFEAAAKKKASKTVA